MTAWHEKLQIDRHRLDDMLVEQPQMFWEVADAHAQAVSRRDAARERCGQTDATIANRIRMESDKKPTEASIVQAIERDDAHIAARKEYLKEKESAEMLAALKDSFAMRAHMLRDLAQLYIAGYFSDSSVRGKQAAAEHQATDVIRQKVKVARLRLRSKRDGADASAVQVPAPGEGSGSAAS